MFSTVHDLEHLSYTSCRRYSAVIVNTCIVQDTAQLTQWAHPIIRDSVRFCPEEHAVALTSMPDDDAVCIAEDESKTLKAFAVPVVEGGRTFTTGGLAGRTYGAGIVLPTSMASYCSSVRFSREFLREKGLHAWLIRESLSHFSDKLLSERLATSLVRAPSNNQKKCMCERKKQSPTKVECLAS